jgi:hypothetical protein
MLKMSRDLQILFAAVAHLDGGLNYDTSMMMMMVIDL